MCNYCATREARKYANYVEVLSLGSQQTSMLDAATRIWRRGGGLYPLLLRGRRGLVSVGMSLVFNVSIRLDGIASVYAGPNDPQIAGN